MGYNRVVTLENSSIQSLLRDMGYYLEDENVLGDLKAPSFKLQVFYEPDKEAFLGVAVITVEDRFHVIGRNPPPSSRV